MNESTSDLSDANGEHARVLPPVLRHFGGRRRFSGEVVTVRCLEDNSLRKNGEGQLGVPVEIAGIPCAPGDTLVADEDGIILLS